MTDTNEQCGLKRCISWKHGFLIGIGIPLAIIPSIGITVELLWAASVLLWGLSVIQGFIQNMAFAELATTFPNASGIPGFCQEIFKSKDGENKRFDRGRFIGGFCGWAYWLVWAPGLAVFIIIISNYLGAVFPDLAAMDQLQLNIILGLIILGGLAIIASTGLKSGALLGLIVGMLTIVPIALIALAPFATGNFHLENLTSAMVPADWTWDGDHMMMVLGLVVIAQWSACCWEMVAVYGPEYQKPSVDVPKALFAAGIVCLIMYVLIQTSVIGALGVEGVLAEPISPLYGVAVMCFGSLAGSIVILLMVFACILLIQIGYSAGARAMHAMALEGNLPRWFAKTNRKGEPMRGILVIALFNLALLFILQGNPVAILAMSAIGYVFVFAIALFAYVKASRDPALKDLERPYKAPRGWKWIALVLAILQMPFLLIGAVYINNLAYGIVPTMVGFGVLVLFIPLWLYSQRENYKERMSARTKEKAELN
ncbi:MAG: APC family permease [Methanomassiliicoccus sp.]|nr:APC family permease [Methanomassiliicoccus sp.]